MIKNKLFIAPIVLILIIFISSFIVGSCKITEGVGKESKVTEDTLTKEETKEEISIAEDETIAEVTSISVEEVYDMTGKGIIEWEEKGYPVEVGG